MSPLMAADIKEEEEEETVPTTVTSKRYGTMHTIEGLKNKRFFAERFYVFAETTGL